MFPGSMFNFWLVRSPFFSVLQGLIEIETPLEAPVMVHFTVLEVQQVAQLKSDREGELTKENWQIYYLAGWCFGAFFIFPYIGNFIIPTDFHIFQRG